MTSEKTKTLQMTVSASFMTEALQSSDLRASLEVAARCLPNLTVAQFCQIREGNAWLADVDGGVEVRS